MHSGIRMLLQRVCLECGDERKSEQFRSELGESVPSLAFTRSDVHSNNLHQKEESRYCRGYIDERELDGFLVARKMFHKRCAQQTSRCLVDRSDLGMGQRRRCS